MPSSRDAAFEKWIRRLHYWLGLYFLFFLWLFAFTGLLLNHPGWRFADFWPQRRESRAEKPIQPPGAGRDLDRARDLMRQLNLAGEIDWPNGPQPAGRLAFSVGRPGKMVRINADLEKRTAIVDQVVINTWGVARVLHTFSGVRVNRPEAQRDWALTTVWVAAMDALAAGLLFMALSGLYVWWRTGRRRAAGLAALGAGILGCWVFLV